ncbi:MAG: ATP:cob(I)alamin adenosyltransferase [Anaerolineaceae bacterium]|nr:ATP:cob(I)alamin adenosyltransferase [Anaerolineaceae bacterium]
MEAPRAESDEMPKKIGYSSLADGAELSKSDFHFDVLGSIDECSAAIALAKSLHQEAGTRALLTEIQKDLSFIMGAVAGMQGGEAYFQERLTWIEGQIIGLKGVVVLPKAFILPGENSLEASLDLARTFARRAERALAKYAEAAAGFDQNALQYLNRVSTVLYLHELKSRNEGA